MIRTGDEYRESLRDGRAVWIDGEQVHDVPTHPAFKSIVDARARIYDLAHEQATHEVMTYVDEESGERCPVGAKRPLTKQDWRDKRAAVDRVLDDLGGIVTRVGDETVGEMWSLYDGQNVLNDIDPPSRSTSGRTFGTPSWATRSTCRPTPTPRAIARGAPRTRIPTCCSTSPARPTAGSSCAGPSSRRPRRTRTRRSSNRRSATGATPSSRTTRSGSSSTWARRASSTSAAPRSRSATRSTIRWPRTSTRSTR